MTLKRSSSVMVIVVAILFGIAYDVSLFMPTVSAQSSGMVPIHIEAVGPNHPSSPAIGKSSSPSPKLIRPTAHRPIVSDPGNTALIGSGYTDVASRIGWHGGSVAATARDRETQDRQQKARFEQWLLEHEYAVFDTRKVEDYMTRLVDRKNDQTQQTRCAMVDGNSICGGGPWYRWEWFPLAGAAMTASTRTYWRCADGWAACDSSHQVSGTEKVAPTARSDDTRIVTLGENAYREDYILPIPRGVLMAADEIRAAWPEAEFDVTLVDRKVDPFLAVRFRWGRVVFAAWDEPDFKP